MKREAYTVDCPLCTEKNAMLYRPLPNASTGIGNGTITHAWVCEHCPAILFEYYSSTNTRTLHDNLESENSANQVYTLHLDETFVIDVPIDVIFDFCKNTTMHAGGFLNQYTYDDALYIEKNYEVNPRYKKKKEVVEQQ